MNLSILVTLFIVLCLSFTLGEIYAPPGCATQCGNPFNFISKLPVEQGPAASGSNRAYAWAIIALIQTKLNSAALSPPAAGRITAIVGTCLYEATAIVEPNYVSYAKKSYKFRIETSPAIKAAVMDGAGYWAVRQLFEDTASFGRIFRQYQNFADNSIRDLIPAIEAAVRAPASVLAKESREQPTRITAVRAGAAACQRVIERYTADGYGPRGGLGGKRNPSSYRPVNSPQIIAGITDCNRQIKNMNKWQPLCVPNRPGSFGTRDCTPQRFVYPWAGRYAPFALQAGSENSGNRLTIPPPQAGSAQFRREWEEVLEYSANLGDWQKIIAEYWADGPDTTFPAGHYWKIAADAALGEDLTPSQTARLLFIVGNAVYDAGIASWRTKVTYDYVRPLQMIQCGAYRNEKRRAWLGPYQGSGLTNISQWRPYQATTFVTPDFSAYVSGHSTFSAAGSEALRLFFGDDKYRGPRCDRVSKGQSRFEPFSNAVPGKSNVPNKGPGTSGYVPADDVVLCWNTFTDASDQSGQSRLYGGIHIKADDRAGQALGRRIGQAVFRKANLLLTGGAIFG